MSQSGFASSAGVGLRLYCRALGWTTAVLALVSALVAGVTALAVMAVSELSWAQRADVFMDGQLSVRGIFSLALQVGLPAGIVILALAFIGFVAVAVVLGDLRQGREVRFTASLAIGVTRLPAVAAAFGIALLEVLLAIALAAVISLAGALLLLARGAVAGAKWLRGRARTGGAATAALAQDPAKPANPWLSWRMLIIYTVPFGLAATIWVHSLLLLPVAALERRGPLAVLRRSSALVQGSASKLMRVLGLALLGAVLYALMQLGIDALRLTGIDAGVLGLITVFSQALTGALPIALLVEAYFGASGGVPREFAIERPKFARNPLIAATAAGVTAALAIGMVSGLPAQPAWAEDVVPPATDSLVSDGGATPGADDVAGTAEANTAAKAAESADGSGDGSLATGLGGEGGENASEADGTSEGNGNAEAGGEGGSGGGEGEPADSWWYPGIKLGSPACFFEPESDQYKYSFRMCIDDLGDAGDAVQGDGFCLTAAGTCTLRAAVEENNNWRPQGISSVFPASESIAGGTILLASTIVFTTNLDVDGLGDFTDVAGITIDGQHQRQLLRFDATGGFGSQLRNLTLQNGFAGGSAQGGALELLRGRVGIERVTLDNNHAELGAPAANAVFAPGGETRINSVKSTFRNNGVPACNAAGFGVSEYQPVEDWRTTIDVPDPSCPGALSSAASVDTSVWLSVDPVQPQRGGAVQYRAQVTPAQHGGDALSGTATFYITGQDPLVVQVPASGLAETPVLVAPGTPSYSVRVEYSGSTGYRASWAEQTVTTGGAISTLTLNATSDEGNLVFRGHPLRLTATVASGSSGEVPTGEVTFWGSTSGGGEAELGTATLDADGRAELETTVTTDNGESHSGSLRWGVRAEYSGDAGHSPSAADQYLELDPDRTAMTITPSIAAAAPGEAITFTVRVASKEPGAPPVAGGTVRVSKPGGSEQETLTLNAQGEASFTVAGLPYGEHFVSATYSGATARYRTASAQILYAVTGAVESRTTVTRLSPDTTYPGDAVEFLVGVGVAPGTPEGGPAPSGIVRLMRGNVQLDQAPLTADAPPLHTRALELGTTELRVEYLGDSNFRASSATISQTVVNMPTRVGLSAERTSSVVGQPLGLTVSVNTSAIGQVSQPVTSGTVEVYADAALVTTIDLGTSDTATALLPPGLGAVQLRAVYLGDDRYAAAQSSAIPHGRTQASTVAQLELSAPTATYPGMLEATVRVTGAAPSTAQPDQGTVRLLLANNTELASGTLGSDGTVRFSVDTARILPGTHAIRAEFGGSPWFTGSVSQATPLAVSKHTPELSLAVSAGGAPAPGETVWGESVQLDAIVQIPWTPNQAGSDALGTISFFRATDGREVPIGQPVAVTEQNRRATLALSPEQLPVGTHGLVARFTPSLGAAGRLGPASTAPTPHTVLPVPVTLSLNGLDGITTGEAFTRSVIVREDPAHATGTLPEGSIAVTLDGVSLGNFPLSATPVAQGSIANVNFPALGSGPHSVVVRYLPAAGTPHAEVSRDFGFTAGGLAPSLSISPEQSFVLWGEYLWVEASARPSSQWAPEPRGTIVVSDGEPGGASCEIAVAPGVQQPQTRCPILWDRAGQHALTAAFVPHADEASYMAGETAPVQIEVRHRPASITGFAQHSGQGLFGWSSPTAGDVVTASWNVTGADRPGGEPTGAVSVAVTPSGVAPASAAPGSPPRRCDTALRDARCDIPLSIAASNAADLAVTVSYPGDERYLPASWTLPLSPRACVVLDLRVEPAGAGTITPHTAPSCGDPGAAKTGYPVGTTLGLSASPRPSGEPSFDWVLSDPVTPVHTATGNGLVVSQANNWGVAKFSKSFQCVAVQIERTIVSGTAGEVSLPGQPGSAGTAPNCRYDGSQAAGARFAPAAGEWSVTGSSVIAPSVVGSGTTGSSVIGSGAVRNWSAWYLRGTELSGLQLNPGRPDTRIYAFESRDFTRAGDWGIAPRTLQSAASLRVTFGPACYAATATSTGPGAVRILNQKNCAEPGGIAGWYADTVLDVYANPDALGDRGLTYATYSFLRDWQGTERAGQSATARQGAGVGVGEALARNGSLVELAASRRAGDEVDTVRVVAGSAAPAVRADFGTCVPLRLADGKAVDESTQVGVAKIITAGNCVNPQANNDAATAKLLKRVAEMTYFETGTQVTVETPQYIEDQVDKRLAGKSGVRSQTLDFSGWQKMGGASGMSEPRLMPGSPDMTDAGQRQLTLALGASTELRPRYNFPQDCQIQVTVFSKDPKRVLPSATLPGVPASCDNGNLEGGPDQLLRGNIPTQAGADANTLRGKLVLSANAAEGLNPLLGWILKVNVRDTSGKLVLPDGSWTATTSNTRLVSDRIVGNQLEIPVGFTSLSAEVVACQQLDFSVNMAREDGTVTPNFDNGDDLMMAYPAPNCPYAQNAWLAGTQVELWALGNPLGYQFEGWSGEAGEGALLAGAAPSEPGSTANPAVASADIASSELVKGLGEDAAFLLDDGFPPGIVTTVVMDGASPTKQVQANYRVQCHDVLIEGFAGGVNWYPEPNCPGFEGQTSYEQYSNHELFEMYKSTQQGQARDWRGMQKMAGPKTMTGRFVGGSEILIQTEGVSGMVWKGWKGDVAKEGRINPATVPVAGDSLVLNQFRDKTTGEQFEDFGNDMAIFGKKVVGFSAVVFTEYVMKYPPLGTVTTMAEAMSLVGTLLEAAGISKGDVAFLHYAKQFSDMLLSPLSCASTWALGSSSDGAVRGMAGVLAEQAKQKTYRVTNIIEAEQDLAQQAREMMAQSDKGLVMSAKLKYYQGKLGVASLSKKVMPAVSVGLAVYGAVQGGGFSWDKDAKSAWTDGSAYTDCIKGAVPDFAHDIAGVDWEQTVLDYGETLRQNLSTNPTLAAGTYPGVIYAGQGASSSPRRGRRRAARCRRPEGRVRR